MKRSCLPLNEMSILKKFLTESKVMSDYSKAKAVYVGSIDGFGAIDFHRKCKGKKNTLILIKARGYFFGGYTSHKWGSTNGYYVGNRGNENILYLLNFILFINFFANHRHFHLFPFESLF